MRIFGKSLILLIGILSTSCLLDKEEDKEVKTFNLSFLTDEVIQINELFVNNYNEGCCLTVYKFFFLIGYNAPRKTIDVFDTELMAPVNQYTIENQGPDAIGEPIGLLMTDSSQILIMTDNELVKVVVNNVNRSLTVVSRYDLKDFRKNIVGNFNYVDFQLVIKNTFGLKLGLENTMSYDSVSNSVFLAKYNVIQNDFESEYFQNALGGVARLKYWQV
ncbi:MAG: hypothetical protein ACJAVN_000986 [Roseivirga sp.]|jgi:hypothetical protein